MGTKDRTNRSGSRHFIFAVATLLARASPEPRPQIAYDSDDVVRGVGHWTARKVETSFLSLGLAVNFRLATFSSQSDTLRFRICIRARRCPPFGAWPLPSSRGINI